MQKRSHSWARKSLKAFEIGMLATVGLLISGNICSGDYYTEYVWYRAIPEECRVVISCEHLRGQSAVDRFHEQAVAAEKVDKYLTYDYSTNATVRHIEKHEKMCGHEVHTVIAIFPPRGTGYCGARPHVTVKVYFDQKLRVDSSLGYDCSGNGYTIPQIVIHAEDKSASLVAYGDDCEIVYNFFEMTDETLISTAEGPKRTPRMRDISAESTEL